MLICSCEFGEQTLQDCTEYHDLTKKYWPTVVTLNHIRYTTIGTPNNGRVQFKNTFSCVMNIIRTQEEEECSLLCLQYSQHLSRYTFIFPPASFYYSLSRVVVSVASRLKGLRIRCQLESTRK